MDQETTASKQLLKGTAMLAVSGLIVKALSAVYRIPYQNIVGDVGFYIYQQVYPIYGIMMVLGGFGFPAAISKLIAHEEVAGKKRQLLAASFVWLFLFGIISFALLFFGAGQIAAWMSDEKLISLIRVVAVSFLIVPFLSVFRGFFQGNGDMLPSAASQTIEQFVRVGTIILSCTMLLQGGYSLYAVGSGAMFGSVAGGLFAVIFLFYYAKKSHLSLKVGMPTLPVFKIVGKALLIQGFAFCLTNMLLVLLQLADSFQLYRYLLDYGLLEMAAKSLKGVYDRGQPLLQLGTVVSTSMGLSVIPFLAKGIKSSSREAQFEKAKLAMKMSVGIGLGASTGLIVLFDSINIMLFEDDRGGMALMILMGSVFLVSIIVTGAVILQTIGKVRSSVATILLAVVIKMIGNALLIPRIGVEGASIASVTALGVTALVIIGLLQQKFSRPILSKKEFLGLLMTDGVMILGLLLYAQLFELNTSRTTATIHGVSASLLGGILYLVLLFRTKFFTQAELTLFPMGGKLQFLLPKKKVL